MSPRKVSEWLQVTIFRFRVDGIMGRGGRKRTRRRKKREVFQHQIKKVIKSGKMMKDKFLATNHRKCVLYYQSMKRYQKKKD